MRSLLLTFLAAQSVPTEEAKPWRRTPGGCCDTCWLVQTATAKGQDLVSITILQMRKLRPQHEGVHVQGHSADRKGTGTSSRVCLTLGAYVGTTCSEFQGLCSRCPGP